MEQLLHDSDRRETLGLTARNRAKDRYSVQAMVAGYIDLYQDVIHQRGHR
jgi:glycosyltransferase involved in cell wall biosynthesis